MPKKKFMKLMDVPFAKIPDPEVKKVPEFLGMPKSTLPPSVAGVRRQRLRKQVSRPKKVTPSPFRAMKRRKT